MNPIIDRKAVIATEPTNGLSTFLAEIDVPDINSMRHMTLQMMKSSVNQTSKDNFVISSNLEVMFNNFVELQTQKQNNYDEIAESAVSVLTSLENELTSVISETNIMSNVKTYLYNRKISFATGVKIENIKSWFDDINCQPHRAISNYLWINRLGSIAEELERYQYLLFHTFHTSVIFKNIDVQYEKLNDSIYGVQMMLIDYDTNVNTKSIFESLKLEITTLVDISHITSEWAKIHISTINCLLYLNFNSKVLIINNQNHEDAEILEGEISGVIASTQEPFDYVVGIQTNIANVSNFTNSMCMADGFLWHTYDSINDMYNVKATATIFNIDHVMETIAEHIESKDNIAGKLASAMELFEQSLSNSESQAIDSITNQSITSKIADVFQATYLDEYTPQITQIIERLNQLNSTYEMDVRNSDFAALEITHGQLISQFEFDSRTQSFKPTLTGAIAQDKAARKAVLDTTTAMDDIFGSPYLSTIKNIMGTKYMTDIVLNGFINNRELYKDNIYSNEVADQDLDNWTDKILEVSMALTIYNAEYSWMNHLDQWKIIQLNKYFNKNEFNKESLTSVAITGSIAGSIALTAQDVNSHINDVIEQGNQKSRSDQLSGYRTTYDVIKDLNSTKIAYCDLSTSFESHIVSSATMTPVPMAPPPMTPAPMTPLITDCFINITDFSMDVTRRSFFMNDIQINQAIFKFQMMPDLVELINWVDFVGTLLPENDEFEKSKKAVADTQHGLYHNDEFEIIAKLFDSKQNR